MQKSEKNPTLNNKMAQFDCLTDLVVCIPDYIPAHWKEVDLRRSKSCSFKIYGAHIYSVTFSDNLQTKFFLRLQFPFLPMRQTGI